MSLSKPIENLANATSAAVGGCFSTVCLYPLDTLKNRIQSSKKASNESRIDLTGLYQGIQFKAVQSTSAKFLYFYFYSFLISLQRKNPSTFVSLACGYLAEGMHLPLTIPIELVATRMQTSKSSSGIYPTICQILKENNGSFLGFYRGAAAYFVLCLQPAIQYTIYEKFKSFYLSNYKPTNKVLSLLEAFLIGAAARSIATVILFPYIRAKVLMQTKTKEKPGGEIGIMSTMAKLIENEGIISLYQGLTPEITRGALSSALMLMMKEKIHVYTLMALKLLSSPQAVTKSSN